MASHHTQNKISLHGLWSRMTALLPIFSAPPTFPPLLPSSSLSGHAKPPLFVGLLYLLSAKVTLPPIFCMTCSFMSLNFCSNILPSASPDHPEKHSTASPHHVTLCPMILLYFFIAFMTTCYSTYIASIILLCLLSVSSHWNADSKRVMTLFIYEYVSCMAYCRSVWLCLLTTYYFCKLVTTIFVLILHYLTQFFYQTGENLIKKKRRMASKLCFRFP